MEEENLVVQREIFMILSRAVQRGNLSGSTASRVLVCWKLQAVFGRTACTEYALPDAVPLI